LFAGLVLTTPPAAEPVSLPEAKAHLRVDAADDDSLITALITAAREYCEAFQNRAYVTQAWQLWLDAWPEGSEIRIPRPPLQAVNGVKYYGADNTEYVLPPADYFVDTRSEPGRIVLAYGKSWPSVTLRPANAVCVEFVAGYGGADKMPQRVKQAMYLLIGHWYEHREAVLTGSISKEIEFAVNSLLWLDRVIPV
jgi:phage conserved hypothetical protein, phiE125 gp8 family